MLNLPTFVYPVLMIDEPLHTDDHPFCSDPDCICHDDKELVQEHITKPLNEGLLTNAEAMRLYWRR